MLQHTAPSAGFATSLQHFPNLLTDQPNAQLQHGSLILEHVQQVEAGLEKIVKQIVQCSAQYEQ